MNRRFVEAILSSFRDDGLPQAVRTFASTSPAEWARGLHWLDQSGLALYFLARLSSAECTYALPENVFGRLSHNSADNRLQSEELLGEFAAINGAFQELGCRYATLKGFSLIPDYCPDAALRCQFDLDYLIDRSAANSFADALRALGYQCVHSGQNSWEFKKGTSRVPSIRDLYRPKPQKSVELHFQLGHSQSEDAVGDPLTRVEDRCLHDSRFSTLSAADAFVYQSLHLAKHIGSEWTRLSWLLEFRNFVSSRRDGESFWSEVHERAGKQRECAVAIGITTLLATMAFGAFAPQTLTKWTTCELPPAIRLWIDRYGWSILLADFPGTKLYLLLRRELMDEQNWRQLRRSRLLPFHTAPRVTQQPSGGQRLLDLDQLRFSALRLRFHCIEGLRYFVESARWRRFRLREVSHKTTSMDQPAGVSVAARN